MVPMTRSENTAIISAKDQEGSLQGCATALKSVNLTVYFKGYLYQRIGFDLVLFFPLLVNSQPGIAIHRKELRLAT